MKKHSDLPKAVNYIETPRKANTTSKIDMLLEQRMKEFMLTRRRIRWLKFGI